MTGAQVLRGGVAFMKKSGANGRRKWPHSEEILAAFYPILGDLEPF